MSLSREPRVNFYETVGLVFTSPNLFLACSILTIFVIMQVILFQASVESLQKDIHAKSTGVVVNYYKNNAALKTEFCSFLADPVAQKKLVASAQAAEAVRKKENKTLVSRKAGPMIAALVFLTLLLYMKARGNPGATGKIGLVLYAAIMCSFATVLLFYLTVVKNIAYVGELQIIQEISRSNSTEEWESILFDGRYLFDNPYIHIKPKTLPVVAAQ